MLWIPVTVTVRSAAVKSTTDTVALLIKRRLALLVVIYSKL